MLNTQLLWFLNIVQTHPIYRLAFCFYQPHSPSIIIILLGCFSPSYYHYFYYSTLCLRRRFSIVADLNGDLLHGLLAMKTDWNSLLFFFTPLIFTWLVLFQLSLAFVWNFLYRFDVPNITNSITSWFVRFRFFFQLFNILSHFSFVSIGCFLKMNRRHGKKSYSKITRVVICVFFLLSHSQCMRCFVWNLPHSNFVWCFQPWKFGWVGKNPNYFISFWIIKLFGFRP